MTTNNFKPILYNTEMVLAILAGRKTQTRRVLKIEKPFLDDETEREFHLRFIPNDQYGPLVFYSNHPEGPVSIDSESVWSKYNIGDILWVRETFQKLETVKHKEIDFLYKADVEYHNYFNSDLVVWTPSIHMPKEAARIFLKVTNVRCERLQDISEEDAIAEGVEGSKKYGFKNYVGIGTVCAEVSFETLWDSINAKKNPWESNPWVWVYDFERIEKPADFNL